MAYLSLLRWSHALRSDQLMCSNLEYVCLQRICNVCWLQEGFIEYLNCSLIRKPGEKIKCGNKEQKCQPKSGHTICASRVLGQSNKK